MSADGVPPIKVMKTTKKEDAGGSKYWDFSAQSPLLNFCLHMDGGELWAPRDVLACHSEPLMALIYGPFKEKDSGEVDLEGKSYEDVLEWLRCIVPCPRRKPVDGRCSVVFFRNFPYCRIW